MQLFFAEAPIKQDTTTMITEDVLFGSVCISGPHLTFFFAVMMDGNGRTATKLARAIAI